MSGWLNPNCDRPDPNLISRLQYPDDDTEKNDYLISLLSGMTHHSQVDCKGKSGDEIELANLDSPKAMAVVHDTLANVSVTRYDNGTWPLCITCGTNYAKTLPVPEENEGPGHHEVTHCWGCAAAFIGVDFFHRPCANMCAAECDGKYRICKECRKNNYCNKDCEGCGEFGCAVESKGRFCLPCIRGNVPGKDRVCSNPTCNVVGTYRTFAVCITCICDKRRDACKRCLGEKEAGKGKRYCNVCVALCAVAYT